MSKKFRLRKLFFNSSTKIKKDLSNFKKYKSIINDLYECVHENSQNSYILDSSKDSIFEKFYPAQKILKYVYYMSLEIQYLSLIHKFLEEKQIIDENRSFLMGTSFVKSLQSWYFQNYIIEKLHSDKKYFQIKFEDIIDDKNDSKLIELFDKIEKWGFINKKTTNNNHSFSGNPVRLNINSGT